MGNNQVENQDENQDDKNISCNVFLEQIELLNQLPMSERGSVIYMALLKAFGRVSNQDDNQDDNQLENQLENTYISISKSISLSKLSITVLNLLNKTLNCKIYSKNWGGKRIGSGKPLKENQKNQKQQTETKTKTKTETKTKAETIRQNFNQICKNLPKVEKITSSRLKHITARLKEITEEDFTKIFTIVNESEFLCGNNNRNWRASFDWIIENDTNYIKILEGRYNNKKSIERQGLF